MMTINNERKDKKTMKDMATELAINLEKANRMGLECFEEDGVWHIGSLMTNSPAMALSLLQELMGGFYE
jgi:hypothetical protein